MTFLTDRELEERYDSMLDEVYGEVEIAGLKYCTSRVLSEVDPTAYRCGFSDWLDAECQNEILFEVNGEYTEENPDDEATHTESEAE